MKTRTDLRAGDALQTCKQQKENWKAKAENMQRILANCQPYNPVPPSPPQPTPPPSGGGWVGGVWYSDKSGICG